VRHKLHNSVDATHRVSMAIASDLKARKISAEILNEEIYRNSQKNLTGKLRERLNRSRIATAGNW
jgi:hypothetical protein